MLSAKFNATLFFHIQLMFVRFIIAFFLGSVAVFLLMLPSAVRHGWSLSFSIILLSSGIVIGLLGMLFSASAWKSLFNSWAGMFK